MDKDLPDYKTLSGLELLTRAAELNSPLAAMGETMNFWLVAAEPGRVELHGAATEAHINVMGGVHGGWYGSLLDSVLGSAVMSHLPAGVAYTTLEYRVNIVRALRPGMVVSAIGESQHMGRSTGVARAEIRGLEDGKLYATGSTTCMILGR